MPVDYDTEHLLKLETKAQQNVAVETLKVLRYLLRRMQDEQRKHWSSQELIGLLDTLMVEISTGVSHEDKDRQRWTQVGERDFTAGKLRTDNPLSVHDKAHAWWDAGWHDAERKHRQGKEVITQSAQPRTASQLRKPGRYRIQLLRDSQLFEWNEALHMFADKGGGSLYADYEEAQIVVSQLRNAAEGTLTIIDNKAAK